MEVRIATKADIASLVALRLEYLRADYSVLPKEVEQVLRVQLPLYFSRHLGKDCHVYLAEEHQSAVSCAFLIVLEKPANPTFPTGKVGAVMNVYTRPVYRRRGFACALLERLISDARKMDLSYLELKATEQGLHLYQRLGFNREISRYLPMRLILK